MKCERRSAGVSQFRVPLASPVPCAHLLEIRHWPGQCCSHLATYDTGEAQGAPNCFRLWWFNGLLAKWPFADGGLQRAHLGPHHLDREAVQHGILLQLHHFLFDAAVVLVAKVHVP